MFRVNLTPKAWFKAGKCTFIPVKVLFENGWFEWARVKANLNRKVWCKVSGQ